jgi:hypothetical protein
MAVTTIQAEFAHVMFVAERDGLRPSVVNLGDVGCVIDHVHGVSQPRNEDHRAIDAYASDGIRAVVKYLSHTCVPRSPLRGVQPGRF